MSNHHRRSSVIPRPHHVAATRSRALLAPLPFVLLLQQAIPAAGQTVPPPGSGMYYGQKFNPSMAIIMVVLVAVFFLLGFLSVYIRQCALSRFNANNNHDGEGTFLFGRGSLRGAARGLDPSIMDTFPTFEYSSVKGLKIGKGSLECAVCLNEFEDDDALRLLPRCNHLFHSNCIDLWLSSHTTCPVCRDNLVPKPGETFEPIVLDIAGQEPTLPSGITSDQVCVHVHDEHDRNLDAKQSNLDDRRVPPRSRSTGMRFTRLFQFPRSHSTGHSLVQPGANHERFTLRLPEEVRDEIIRSASLKRVKSCATAFPRARSARTGFRRSGSNGGGRSIRGKSYFDYERFNQDDQRASQRGCSMTPPFIRRTSSVRSARDQDVGMTPPSWRPERSPPLNWLFVRKDGDQGERSSDRLRPPDNQA